MLGLPCHSTVEYKQLIENKSVLSKRITSSPYVMVTLSPNCCLKSNPVTVTEGMLGVFFFFFFVFFFGRSLGVWITCLKVKPERGRGASFQKISTTSSM